MALTLDELAALLEAEVLGDGCYRVHRCGEGHTSGAGVLTCIGTGHDLGDCVKSGAAFLAGEAPHAIRDGFANGLVCAKPRLHFNALNRLLLAHDALACENAGCAIAASAFVHASARLAPGCVVQAGARVEAHAALFPGVVLEKNAHVGAGCIVRSRAVICERAVLGPLCEIGSGSVIGAEPQQFETADGTWTRQIVRTRARLGKRVVIGANSVLESGARRETVVESDVIIGGQVYVAHDCHIEQGVLIIGQSGLASGVHIESGAALMGRVAVDVDVRIGAGALVLATSGVTKDIPPGSRVWGNPARERNGALRMVSRRGKILGQ